MADLDTDGAAAGQPDDAWDGLPGVPVDGYPGLRAGVPGGEGLLGLASFQRSSGGAATSNPDQGLKYCPPVPARIMQGNMDNVSNGKIGGWGFPVTANGTAVDPAQWGGRAALRPYLGQISGASADGTPLFNGISDVVGGKTESIGGQVYDAAHVRDGIKATHPGQLVLEIPNKNDMGTKSVVLRVPKALDCPKP